MIKYMDNKNKRVIIISIISLAIVLITASYAYFSARITGLESASTISLTAGKMEIEYSEGDENVSAQNMYPRNDAWITKTFTLTANNSTEFDTEYEVGLNIITNTFKGGQLTYSLEVDSQNIGTIMSSVNNKSITGSNRTMLIGRGSFPGNTTNGKQKYTLYIYILKIMAKIKT